MCKEWETVSIGDICQAIYDGPHATPKKTSEGPIFLGISNLQNGQINLTDSEHLSEEDFIKWTRRVTPQENDIVFSYETRLGEAALVPNGLKFCLGRRMALMRPDKSKVEPRFLLYAYLGPEFQQTLQARTVHGSTVDRIPLIEFPSFPISLPPLPEQHAIAKVLGALDDKIELNRRMNATLEAMARTVFQRWFIDNEDVANWKVGKLGDIAENIRHSVQPEDIEPGTPYIGLEHMPRGSISLSDWGNSNDISSNKFYFKKGEFLFGKLRPYFHKVGIAPLNGVCSTDILIIMPKTQDWYGFVLGHISSVEVINYTNAASTGTKMPRTNWLDIANYGVPIPPIKIVREYTEIFLPMARQILANVMQSSTLASLRDTLLPKLMRGEVRVKNIP